MVAPLAESRLEGTRVQELHTWLSSCDSWVLEHRLNGLVAPRHVASSRVRDLTHVSCIGRWIL